MLSATTKYKRLSTNLMCVYIAVFRGGEAGRKSNWQVQGYRQHHLSNLKNKMDTLECFNLLW